MTPNPESAPILGEWPYLREKSHCTRAWFRSTVFAVTKTSWGTYVQALSDSQAEIAERAGVSQPSVSRWLNGGVPSVELVIKLARSYGMSPVSALVAAGYLEPDEITNPGTRPRAIQLHEFSDLELARETVRRIEEGSRMLEQPLDADHPVMIERHSNVSAGTEDDGLAGVTQLSRRESKNVPPAKAAKRKQRKKDDHVDD